MAWVMLEIEYVCPLCGALSIEFYRVLIRNVKNDIRKYIKLSTRYCIECEVSELSLPMDVARISMPEKDSFGASLL